MVGGSLLQTPDSLKGYRAWFYAAAGYNLVWGLAVILAPNAVCQALHMKPVQPTPIFQCLGMVVGTFAYGYYLLAREPKRYAGLIWIGLAGKTFGPIGFLFFALRGELPWSFGWTLLTNDLIWWPAFWSFALKFGRS